MSKQKAPRRVADNEALSVGTTNSSVTTVIFPSAPCITTHIVIF